MPLIQRSAGKRSSSPPSPGAPTPNSALPCSGSLTEQRCLRAVQPTADYHHSLFRWTNRLNYDPQYTDETLTARRKALEPEVALLETAVYGDRWQELGERWEAEQRRLNRLKGQLAAIRDEQARRARQRSAGYSWRPGWRPSISAADPAQDPFLLE